MPVMYLDAPAWAIVFPLLFWIGVAWFLYLLVDRLLRRFAKALRRPCPEACCRDKRSASSPAADH